MRWAGHVARMEEIKIAYSISVGIPGGKRPLGRTRKYRMDLTRMGWEGVDWIHLAQKIDQ